jgi:hypothetical protein
MTYQFEKIRNEAEGQSKGVLLTKIKYVIYHNNEEIGYYFTNHHTDYFFYWDDNSAIQSGIVDKREKTIRLNETLYTMNAESMSCDDIIFKITSFNQSVIPQPNKPGSLLFVNDNHQLFIKWQKRTIKKEINQKILFQGEIEIDIDEIGWLFATIAFKEIYID